MYVCKSTEFYENRSFDIFASVITCEFKVHAEKYEKEYVNRGPMVLKHPSDTESQEC